jgi:CheY-like chemotaxis protein
MKKQIALFFDDDPTRHEVFANKFVQLLDIVHAHDPQEAIDLLKAQKFDIVFLDHDMDLLIAGDMTGMDVAEFIALHQERSLNPSRVIVHSWNVTAAAQMEAALKQSGIEVICRPFKV